MAKKAGSTKTRILRPPEEKRGIVFGYMEAKRKDPRLTMKTYSNRIGIHDTQIQHWARQYGPEFGWSGFNRDAIPPSTEATPSPEAAAPSSEGDGVFLPSKSTRGLPVMSGEWEKKNAERLRAALGLPENSEDSDAQNGNTLVSSGPRGKLGRPSNADKAARVKSARAALTTREPDAEQPQLPFTYRAEPVRREEPPAPNEFMRRALERSLKERDALLTTLEIMFREGRMPTGGPTER